ncbi:MAG: hypothetical protein ACTSRP_19370, partial [Candidatus Helarchaeota archaeon]
WARLARERDVEEGLPRDEWIKTVQKEIIKHKDEIKSALESGNYEKAIKLFETIAILYTEINKPESAETARKNAEKIKEKLEAKEIKAEDRELEEQRSSLIEKAQKYEKENKLPQAIKYYKDAAKISEKLGEKEIAIGYMEKARYLLKQSEQIQKEKEKEKELEQKRKKEIEKIKAEILREDKKIDIEKIEAEIKAAKATKVEKLEELPKKIKEPEEIETPEEEVSESELELAKLNLGDLQKRARDALGKDLYATAYYYYSKVRDAYKILGDSSKVMKTENKLKEIKAKMQLEKTPPEQLRIILPRLSAKAENLYKKEKYVEAEKLFLRIADIFFTLEDEEAGEHYFSKAEIARKKASN